MRLALVSGHDDGELLRAVYLFTSGPPDTRVELHVPLDRLQAAMEDWFRRKGYLKPGDRLLVTEIK